MKLNNKQKTAVEKYFQETPILNKYFTAEDFINEFAIYNNYLEGQEEELEWVINSCFDNIGQKIYGKNQNLARDDMSSYWFDWAYDNINIKKIASLILDNQ